MTTSSPGKTKNQSHCKVIDTGSTSHFKKLYSFFYGFSFARQKQERRHVMYSGHWHLKD